MCKLGVFLLFVAMSTVGCSHESKVKAYFDKDNGLWKEKTIGDYVITAQYRPTSIILETEFGRDSLETQAAKKRKQQLEGTLHFNLEFKTKDPSVPMLKQDVLDEKEYVDRLLYFQQKAKDDFEVHIGKLVIPCMSYAFEDSHALTGKDVVIVNFLIQAEDIKNTEDISLHYLDKRLGIGETIFNFNTSDLTKFND